VTDPTILFSFAGVTNLSLKKIDHTYLVIDTFSGFSWSLHAHLQRLFYHPWWVGKEKRGASVQSYNAG